MNLRAAAFLFASTACVAMAQLSDYKDYKDPALFTRMPHYFLVDDNAIVDQPFDAVEFATKTGTQNVEGRHIRYSYTFDEAAGTHPGFLQIIRNYEAAAKKIGGEVVPGDNRRTTLRIVKDGRETWVAVEAFNEGRNYDVNIVERQAMTQDVVADAAALGSGLKETGHVEVTGIFFDTAKSEIKPESEAALKEVAAMLQANAAMKVWVVGHTDNVGTAESNITLSAARSAAVVKALTGRGIDAQRLAAHGAGPYAPVASNATDEGRARNRRVELVARP